MLLIITALYLQILDSASGNSVTSRYSGIVVVAMQGLAPLPLGSLLLQEGHMGWSVGGLVGRCGRGFVRGTQGFVVGSGALADIPISLCSAIPWMQFVVVPLCRVVCCDGLKV